MTYHLDMSTKKTILGASQTLHPFERSCEMDLIDLLLQDGVSIHRVAATNGGEWAGGCPFCGGKDRFRAWPTEGRYWCRGCGKSGDAIQWVREHRGLSFREACDYLGHDPGHLLNRPRPAPPKWEARESKMPTDAWQAKARAFLDKAVDILWTPRGAEMRSWLNAEKGLQDATIKEAGLGLNLGAIFAPRQSWGLEPSIKEDGNLRRQWLPGGLVIPLVDIDGAVHRLRIRHDKPGDGARYVIVSGSSSAPLAWNLEKAAVVVVESELDGLLLNQEVGDLFGVIALGSAQAKPDSIAHGALTATEDILVGLDSDDAGAKAAWAFWPETYGAKVKRWPVVMGKDPSEAFANGLDLRAWAVAGVFGTEERFERFAIQTIEGGLGDTETIRLMEGNVHSPPM